MGVHAALHMCVDQRTRLWSFLSLLLYVELNTGHQVCAYLLSHLVGSKFIYMTSFFHGFMNNGPNKLRPIFQGRFNDALLLVHMQSSPVFGNMLWFLIKNWHSSHV